MMIQYHDRTFPRDRFQWTKCVVNYLIDAEKPNSVQLVVFLSEVCFSNFITNSSILFQNKKKSEGTSKAFLIFSLFFEKKKLTAALLLLFFTVEDSSFIHFLFHSARFPSYFSVIAKKLKGLEIVIKFTTTCRLFEMKMQLFWHAMKR